MGLSNISTYLTVKENIVSTGLILKPKVPTFTLWVTACTNANVVTSIFVRLPLSSLEQIKAGLLNLRHTKSEYKPFHIIISKNQ